MSYQKINNITGWFVWLIATIVFVSTIEPTTSMWDCAEFIASANGLEPGHPPGAPLWMLLARLVIIFSPEGMQAMSVNILSALSSSFTVLFLFWSVTYLAKKIATRTGELTKGALIAVLMSGAVGALSYTFSDSFWFSAVEGEVYAMSSLFTALVFWLILKWEAVADKPGNLKWIILIAYVMGLSIGVHLLNILTIPAMSFIFYFKRYKQVTPKGLVITALIALGLIGVVNTGVIKIIITLAAKVELLFINTFHAGFNTGVIVYAFGFIGTIAALLWYSRKRGWFIANTLTLSILACVIGYSTFAMIVIRSSANPPMDENNPENLFSFLSYLNREQYGNRPLLRGAYFNAPITGYEDGSPVWIKSYSVHDNKGKRLESYRWEWEAEAALAKAPKGSSIVQEYVESTESKGKNPTFDPQFVSMFPRMHSSSEAHKEPYMRWSNYKGYNTDTGRKKVKQMESNMALYRAQIDSAFAITNQYPNTTFAQEWERKGAKAQRQYNNLITKSVPTKVEDIRYFVNYQLNHMYWRYFMWNYSGRQNDSQGRDGTIIEGNWITGLDFIDKEKLGNRKELPQSQLENKGLNKFYLLPFILGLIGLFFHVFKAPKDFWVVLLLFVMTGIAIIVYLNQPPIEPRERDYTSVGSFYAFAIWIGMSVFALYDMSKNLTIKQLTNVAAVGFGVSVFAWIVEVMSSDNHFASFCMFYIFLVGMILIGIAMALRKTNGTMRAAILGVACLIPTIMMAAQGWNDHDRSGRTTAFAFAKDYLDSVAPNAIIFTMGDNDTFPLWYAQEVEGYRRDVRVVNLSLLNTDWYVDQMKRKAWTSDPVPFSAPEIKYRQGTRDMVVLDNSFNKNNIYMDIDEALEVGFSDKYRKQYSDGGSMLDFLPTNKFSLPVDSAKVMELGIVRPEDADKIVDAVEWKIGKPYILKATLMVLDLLNTTQWERPIYFAVTIGDDAFMGLDDYLRLEGLAYRLVPIKYPKESGQYNRGGMDTDIMFENMVNKFDYGGIDNPDGVYLDETNRRQIVNLRLQFNNLAEELIKEEDGERALIALNKCLEVTPEGNVPYDKVMPGIIGSYLKLGVPDSLLNTNLSIEQKQEAQAMAEKLTKRMLEINEDEINYYMSLEPEFAREIQAEVEGYNFGISSQMLEMLQVYFPESELIKPTMAKLDELEKNLLEKQIEMDERIKSRANF